METFSLYVSTVVKHFYQNIHGWFTFPYLYRSVVEYFPSNSHFVEVGAWLGCSAAYMAVEIANSGKKIKFDCIDNWQGIGLEVLEPVKNKTVYETFLKNIEPVKDYITPITGNSVETSKTYTDKSLDFVFIDAAHDYESVLQDINAWFPKVKNGGMISGHDYEWESVRKAVNEYFPTKQIRNSEGCWLVIK